MRSAYLLKVTIGQWKFLPNLWSSLITLLLLPVFVYLGFWQLQRLELKQNLLQDREIAQQGAAITIDALENIKTDILKWFRYRQLAIQGSFLHGKTFLLDNQILKGQVGYRVITPFQTLESNSLILVDRGFIPWKGDRTQLPLIEEPLISVTEAVNIVGMVTDLSQGPLLKEEAIQPKPKWPLLIQKIDYSKLSDILGQEIYPFLLQLPKDNPYAFQSFPFSLGLSPARHLGYAIQWFTMALAVLIYYLIVNSRRR